MLWLKYQRTWASLLVVGVPQVRHGVRDAGGAPGAEAVNTDGWGTLGEGADAVGGPEQARL